MKRALPLFLLAFVACARGAQVRAQSVPMLCVGNGRGETPSARTLDDSLNRSSRPAELVGRIVTVTGGPVRHPAVVLQRALRADSTALGAAVDSTGVFRFASVAPAQYILHIRAIGFGEQWQAIELRPAASDSVCVRLRPRVMQLVPVVPQAAGPVPKPSNDR